MITPSFGITATERVLPNMALDFTTANLDSRVTFTRSGNTATVVNSSGLIASVAANNPRFDYDPITLSCKGLLIEEARSNLTIYSEDFSNATWIYTSPLALSAANSTIAPDGQQTADTLSTTNAGNFRQVVTGITGTSSYSASIFVKTSSTCTSVAFALFITGVTTDAFVLNFNPSTGAYISNSGGTYVITNYGNGWYRYTISGTGTNILNTQINYQLYNNQASANTLVVWGAQLEQGSFPTSYIPTAASQVTRTADVAVMTGTNLTSWFNPSEGALYVKADCYTTTPSGARQPATFNKISGAAGYIALKIPRPSTSTGFTITDDAGTVACDLSGQAITANTPVSIVGAYKANSFSFSDRGVSNVTDAAGAIPTIDRLSIGSDGFIYQNGHIQKIMYWPQRLINAEVQAFSKG
jgi:hypothetical protein